MCIFFLPILFILYSSIIATGVYAGTAAAGIALVNHAKQNYESCKKLLDSAVNDLEETKGKLEAAEKEEDDAKQGVQIADIKLECIKSNVALMARKKSKIALWHQTIQDTLPILRRMNNSVEVTSLV